MLLASFFSKLIGMHLPGKNSLYLSQNLEFKQPAFMGDTVLVSGKITKLSINLQLMTLKTTIHRQSDHQLLVDGEARVLFLTG